MVEKLLLCCSLLSGTSGVYNQVINYDDTVSVLANETSNPFVRIGGFGKSKVLDSIDGYVYYSLEVYKAFYTDVSNLFIIHAVTDFTPGIVAEANNEKFNDGSYYGVYLNKGYVHLTLERYFEGDKHGGFMVPKEFWPKSSTFQTTISTSFSGELNKSFSLNGDVSLGNGGIISGNVGGSKSTGFSFAFSKSASTVSADPVLSAQMSSSNSLEAQWNYFNKKTDMINVGSVTYTLDTYYMFEMNNDYYKTNCDSFILTYSVMYQCGWGTGGMQDGTPYSSNVKISCFL